MSLQLVDTAAPSDAVSAIIAGLARPRNAIEAAFLDVGDVLSRSAGLLDTVSATFEALPRDLERPEVAMASAQLTRVGTQAGEISDSFAREQHDITRLVEVVGKASWPIADLRKTIRMMGIVAVNARVVAATVTTLSDAEVFTADISALASSATSTIADFGLSYDRLQQDVRNAAAARDHFEKAQSGTLSQLAAKIAASLEAVALHRQNTTAGGAETLALSRAIAKRVMAAVMALQVGDATRQRVEHIEATLALTAGISHPAMAALADLAAAQLRDTIATLDDDVATAEQSLTALARDAAAITARGQHVYGADSQGNLALSRLNQDMRQAIDVLQQCERDRRQLGTVAGQVERTVDTLLVQVAAVQEIGANMQLVSLNAAIRCAHLGPQGAALNVIATQLRDLTGETVRAAAAAATELTQAAELALAFGSASGAEASRQMAQLEQNAADGLKTMDAVEKGIGDALALLQQAGAEVAGLLGHASAGFSNHQAISEALSDAHIQITSLGDGKPPAAPASAELAGLLGRVRNIYTMQIERQLHDHMWGHPAAAQTPARVWSGNDDALAAPAPPPADAQVFDDDVLFF